MLRRVVVLAVSLAYFGFSALLRLSRRAVRAPARWPVVVLTYHSVPADDAERFKSQMRELTRAATPMFADAAPEACSRPIAVVTFDDALRCVFENALPIMAEQRIPATIFVPTGFLAAPPGWIPPVRRQPGISGVLASEEVIARSDGHAVRFGSHTVTHPHLTRLQPGAVREELERSRGTLERITAGAVTMLAFPYGSFNNSVAKTAGALGYTRLFSNVPMRAATAGSARLIGRISVSPRDWPLEFKLKVRGGYDWLALAIPVKRACVGCRGESGWS